MFRNKHVFICDIILIVGGTMKSVYIHIPFCKTICSYCDFCKVFYNEKIVDKYLERLKEEIVSNYKGEVIKTLYIGGGTPSCLSIIELEKLFNIVKLFNIDEVFEFTIECNIETLDLEKIELFKKNNVNRVSIGVQSIIDKNIKFLDRHHTKEMVVDRVRWLQEVGIDNINLDLIYALPNQSLKDLNIDLDFYLSLGIKHISTYSLMIEPNTKLGIKNTSYIDEKLDRDMYDYINKKLGNNGFIHYEISNYCIPGYESKHNLTYWNNDEYYGFGVGASGYIDDVRYDNTKSLTNYLNGKTRFEENIVDYNIKIENEFILGLRKVTGISKKEFKTKYNKEICDIIVVKKLVENGKLIDNGEYVYILKDLLYVSNFILVEFLGVDYGES